MLILLHNNASNSFRFKHIILCLMIIIINVLLSANNSSNNRLSTRRDDRIHTSTFVIPYIKSKYTLIYILQITPISDIADFSSW